jgi:hypothetical protein
VISGPRKGTVSCMASLGLLLLGCATGGGWRHDEDPSEVAISTFIRIRCSGSHAHGIAIDGRDASSRVLAKLQRDGISAVPYSSAPCRQPMPAYVQATRMRPPHPGDDWVVVTNRADHATTNCVSLAWHRCLYLVRGGAADELHCEYFATE